MTAAHLLGAVGTPFIGYAGSLTHLRLHDLLGLALAGACERVGVERYQIEDIVAGCVNPPIKVWEISPAGQRWRPASPTAQRGPHSQPLLRVLAERDGHDRACDQGR